jgi:ATP/maltotriose-dependent transcriptional regulator MalT
LALLHARLHVARGDLAEAEATARKAVDGALGIGHVEWAADAWLVLAEIHRARGEEEAQERSAAEEALRLFERKGNLVGTQRARTFLRDR